MEDPIEELRKKILENFTSRKSDWVEKTYSSQQYQQELKYIKDISTDYIDTLRAISIYSLAGARVTLVNTNKSNLIQNCSWDERDARASCENRKYLN